MKTKIKNMQYSRKQKSMSKKLLQKIFRLIDCIDIKLDEYINCNEEDLEKLTKNSINISKVIPELMKITELLLPIVEPEKTEKQNSFLEIVNNDDEIKDMVERLILKLSTSEQ